MASNPVTGDLSSGKVQLQPESNTPKPANEDLQEHLIVTDRPGTELCRKADL